MSRLAVALGNAREHLLSLRNPQGHWTGELSSSALSTATAITALALIDRERHRGAIDQGLRWLGGNQNADGGFGDTVLSFSNLSTTVLVWSAFGVLGSSDAVTSRAAEWIVRHCGSLAPAGLAEKIVARYGRDRTFSVPILMMAALGGRLGAPEEAWPRVLPLPFELAALPRGTFAALRLPVVSYALPALIAIGHARFHHAPPPVPLRWLRQAASARTLRLLQEIQPDSGGYLEATPLTSFVAIALAAAGHRDHPVVSAAERFLLPGQRVDGSWAIDSDLAIWGTTLAVKALGGDLPGREWVGNWLLSQQYKTRHRYTDSPAGGWAWTDRPGGVPDADDTPGALLALAQLVRSPETTRAAAQGCAWLLGLQNRDGGVPTFCRGWGALPFDRSSPDLTAHTLRAWDTWLPHLPSTQQERIRCGARKALAYLRGVQAEDGSWTALWFGNQHRADETNPTYGTAHVCLSLAADDSTRARGLAWLRNHQNDDGGWGGGAETPSSIEETALALDALCLEGNSLPLRRGAQWLIERTDSGRNFPPSPIGFYFAKLWYWEKLYPVVWSVGALRSAREVGLEL